MTLINGISPWQAPTSPPGAFTYQFRTEDGGKYEVEMWEFETKSGRWEAEFNTEGHYGIIGGVKNPSRVFATVLDIMGDWITRSKPKVIVVGSEQQSRTKLYARMVRTLANKYGYVGGGNQTNKKGHVKFVLKRGE